MLCILMHLWKIQASRATINFRSTTGSREKKNNGVSLAKAHLDVINNVHKRTISGTLLYMDFKVTLFLILHLSVYGTRYLISSYRQNQVVELILNRIQNMPSIQSHYYVHWWHVYTAESQKQRWGWCYSGFCLKYDGNGSTLCQAIIQICGNMLTQVCPYLVIFVNGLAMKTMDYNVD